MEEYQSNSWQVFRREVIELDGDVCCQCQRSEAEVVLQVHHKKYVPGRLPWQYYYRDCETLCKGCHAAEHGKIPPKTGWQYLGYEDLGQVAGHCELCGSNFRYQFYVYHKNWGSMLVGAYCSDALTGNKLASDQMSTQKKYDERRQRFVRSKRWMGISGRHILRQKNIRIEIAEVEGQFQIQLDRYPGKQSFKSLNAAKQHVFDIIEKGIATDFLKRKGIIDD